MAGAFLHSINVSMGGVPKTPRPAARVTASGVDGDGQRDRRFHGGPARAVCLYSLDLIRALQAEGHPIGVGTIGENLTIAGVDWTSLAPGVAIEVGALTLEITTPAAPCRNIAGSFADRDFTRVAHTLRPGWSRWYCRVLREGTVAAGDAVEVRSRHSGSDLAERVSPAADDGATVESRRRE